MTELLTAAQMRAIEQAAIASGEVTGLELMERAGRGVVEAIFEEWPELKATSHRAVVLCGPGNNGGDGFVVARLLKGWGWAVEVFLYGDPARLPPDARVNYERWRAMGEVLPLPRLLQARESYAVIIDALFGTGLSRGLDGIAAELVESIYGDPVDLPGEPLIYLQDRTAAIDMPSGYCSDAGTPLGDHDYFRAALTVTFHRPKIGHHLFLCPAHAGRLIVKDIGLGAQHVPDDTVLLGRDETVLDIEWLSKDPTDHKFAHGHALILSGQSGRGGAARLAARGVLRIGAGVVTVGCPPEAIAENAARLDAVMLRGVADGAALAEVLGDARINALCLGPGMGTGAREAGLVAAALGAVRAEHAPYGGRGLVLDADALTILSRTPDLFAALHDGCVLTPHAGEFARLFPDIAEKLAAPATKGPAYSKVDATREAAARAGCVVLYKGPDTVIVDPSGRCAINSAHYDRAAPWLATAGSGDVLAGFITGLLARGFAPFDAACTAAWLHVECARSFGPGLIAEDLPEELPKVFRALGL